MHRSYLARRDEQIARQRQYVRDLRLDVIAHLGGKCACCGETTLEFLAVDHINTDGAAHRRSLTRSGYSGRSHLVWADIRRRGYPRDEFQVLCHNCNAAKNLDGACPHQATQI